MIGAILGGIGGLIGLGTSIYDTVTEYQDRQREIENQNWSKDYQNRQLELQEQALQQQQSNTDRAFNYQRDLNNQIMQREDTAVQRRVADATAAGFSKWSVMGSQASTTALNTSQGNVSGVSSGSGSLGSTTRGTDATSRMQSAMQSAVQIYDAQARVEVADAQSQELFTRALQNLAGTENLSADTKKKIEETLTESILRGKYQAERDYYEELSGKTKAEKERQEHDNEINENENIRSNDQSSQKYTDVRRTLGAVSSDVDRNKEWHKYAMSLATDNKLKGYGVDSLVDMVHGLWPTVPKKDIKAFFESQFAGFR